MQTVEIKTRDGVCPTFVFRPGGDGQYPGVLVFMDGVGIRPALLEIGQRLASAGYLVVLPDLFYRSGPYEPMNPKVVFSDPEQRKALTEKFFAKASLSNVMSDTRFVLDYLRQQPDVKAGGIGTTGYCMGGMISLTAAGTYPNEIAAAASFHGGRLATDAPDSPHLVAPRITASVYVAGAIEDPTFPDEMKARLEKALTDANVRHRIETYPAKHGWVLRDTASYDPACAERHWSSLLGFFGETLRA